MPSSVRTLAQLVVHAWTHCQPDQIVVCERDAYVAVSSAELYRRVARLHLGLGKLGLRRGDYCALLSESRWEQLVADLAMATAGIVGVLLDPTMSSEQVRWMLGNTGARSLLVAGKKQHEKADEIARRRLLDHIVALDAGPGVSAVCSASLAQLIGETSLGSNEKREFHSAIETIQPEDLASIICSSGTPDAGKGVVLTHGEWIAGVAESDLGIRPADVLLCFLPGSPLLARTVEYACLLRGATVVYAATARSALSSLERARPTLVAADTGFFAELHAYMMERLATSGPRRRRLRRWAMQAGARCGLPCAPGDDQIDLADPAIHSAFQARLGGRLRGFLSSGGAVAPEVGEFLGAVGSRQQINISLGPRSSGQSRRPLSAA